MSERTPTRSVAVALRDEHKTMREGYAFLDEKCLLLAGAMLKAVRRFGALREAHLQAQNEALLALAQALARHGLNGLQCYPPARGEGLHVAAERRSLLGVAFMDATLAGTAGRADPAVNASPEAEACRAAFARLLPGLVEMAGISGNLERLYREYRRTVRRVRALQDVLLPEVEQLLHEVESSLEELEQDEALWVRFQR
jgi:V/A-type H+-transporting ATPase subunit D